MGFLDKLPLYKKSDVRYLCMHLIPFTDLITTHYGSCFCLFHHNVNTPAASLFKDSDGVERMYCYTCRRQYSSYDYITTILEKDPIEFLLKKYTKEELDEYLKQRVFYSNPTRKIEFSTIEQLLSDLYNYENALSPNKS